MTDLEYDDVHLGRNQVRVIGVLRERYVEFEFYGGDPCLCVELVMPLTAFHEFRVTTDAEVLNARKEACELYRKLCFCAGVAPLEPMEDVRPAG